VVEMSARLWVVRHGATDWSDAGRLNGWTDVPLNERGRLQATRLAGKLAGRSFAGVWTSDLSRSTETARLAASGSVTDERLRELDFGELEGRTWDECPSEAREALLSFDDFKAPGSEAVAQLRRRVHEFATSLGEGDHLVFTHGGVIKLLLREAGRDTSVAPGALVRIPLTWFPPVDSKSREGRWRTR
jgi:probable phosphoglycerate mutase